MSEHGKKRKGIFLAAACVLALILLVYSFWPEIYGIILFLQNEFSRNLQNYIDSFGSWSWLALLGIQVLQVIVAIIPGEPVEILAGVFCGVWGGMLLCMAGVFLGSLIIFTVIHKYGTRLLYRFISKERLSEFSFLQNTKRLEYITFLLFLIPGTPKDVLTYAVALTDIDMWYFLKIATFARIPSMITSVMAGASIYSGNYDLTIIIFLATMVIGIVGIILHNILTNRMNRKH